MLTRIGRTIVGLGCLLSALAIVVLSGCGGDSGPVTAESSKFKPSAGGAAKPAASATDAGATQAASLDTDSPTSSEGTSTASDAAVPSSPFAQKTGAETPAGSDDASGAKYPLPKGDTQALLRFVDELGQRDPEGTTRDEVLADATAIQEARLRAARQALQSGKLDGRTRDAVVQVCLQIHELLAQLGVPDAKKRYDGFLADLAAGDDPELAEVGRLRQSEARLQALLSSDPPDGEAVAAEVKQLVADEKQSAAAFMLGSRVCEALDQAAESIGGLRPALIELRTFLGTTYEKSAEEQIAAVAKQHQELARAWRQDLYGKCDAVQKGEEGAGEKLVAAVEELVALRTTSALVHTRKTAQRLEAELGEYELTLQVYELLTKGFAEHEDQEVVQGIAHIAENARKRIGLIGKPLAIEGVLINGKPYDPKSVAGKVVLVDFWATWCGPCLREFPNIRRNYLDYREKGFEVVGISLDSQMEHLEQFFSRMELPWTVVIGQELFEKKSVEGSSHPLAEACGVESIPFVVLIGKDGNVDSIHVRGEKLGQRLAELLGEPAPAAENPADAKAAPDDAKDSKPAAKDAADDAPAAEQVSECGVEEPAADEAATAEEEKINPYSAKPGLSTADLVRYIERMLDKPKSIQARPGFAEALAEACDRVLQADPPAKEDDQLLAAATKFETLHQAACAGNAQADEQLAAFCEQMKADPRPPIASQVAFFALERKVLAGDKLPPDEIAPLLQELADYFAKEKLTARHLRIASSTVALINRLEEGEEREKHFASFGNAFARSSDKELARYGKKLAKKPAAAESDLVGQEMELAGTTVAGNAFDWKKYRGKVVLVDFWATWCGPCLRELPHVRETYDKLHDQGLEIVGISLDKDREALDTFLAENQLPWETLAGDETQELAEKYGVRGIPTMMVVDKDGKILGVAHQVAALRPILEKALRPDGNRR